MAKLLKTPAPGNWDMLPNEDLKEYFDRENKEFDKIKENVIRFPMADSYAFYYVKTLKPLVLQHVPYGDKWNIPDAHIRGLRARDVEEMLNREHTMRILFGGKK